MALAYKTDTGEKIIVSYCSVIRGGKVKSRHDKV
jgi:hypothetical protein